MCIKNFGMLVLRFIVFREFLCEYLFKFIDDSILFKNKFQLFWNLFLCSIISGFQKYTVAIVIASATCVEVAALRPEKNREAVSKEMEEMESIYERLQNLYKADQNSYDGIVRKATALAKAIHNYSEGKDGARDAIVAIPDNDRDAAVTELLTQDQKDLLAQALSA